MDFSHAFISHTIRSTSDGEEKEGEVSDEHVDEECEEIMNEAPAVAA